jgi:DNA repair exonuclease SbcCD nuclease subunit
MTDLEVTYSEATISYPYAVISDVHLHPWSQFSYTLPNGRNNRLQQILDGIEQAATHLLKIGGNDLVITGDLFHTRGNVKPSVLNPTVDLFADLTSRGVTVHGIPGNHDLEGINSDSLGNAMHSLSMLSDFTCYTSPTLLSSKHLFIPWYEDSKKILNLANERSYPNPNLTLFAHVGLNGVIPARIGNTINPDDFDKGFKYVFCGHFHNHVSFDGRVFSVGALTHQTWSDVGSEAGYLIVYEDRVEHFATNAPTFIAYESDATKCHNKFVRLRGTYSESDCKSLLQDIKRKNALAVLDQTTRPTLVEKRHEHEIKVELGIDAALEAYCKHTFGDNWQKVYDECVKLKS